jgi:hypothetical protein
VARALGSDEIYFWPALLGREQSKNATNAELVQVWPARGDVPGDVWRSLFQQAADQVDVLVYSGGFLIEAYNRIETIRESPPRAPTPASWSATHGATRSESAHARKAYRR